MSIQWFVHPHMCCGCTTTACQCDCCCGPMTPKREARHNEPTTSHETESAEEATR